MKHFGLRLLLSLSLSTFFLFASSTHALAVIQSLNGQTGNTQTFQNDTNIAISSANNVHSLTWQGLLGISRGGTGANSFMNGSIPFIWNGIFSQDNSNLYWDNTNKRLGIGTSSPSSTVDINGMAKVSSLTSTSDSVIHTINVGMGGGSIDTNTVFGKYALTSSSSGNGNTAVGFNNLSNGSYSGEGNTAVGAGALTGDTSGSWNSAFGGSALQLNTTGIQNVAGGVQSLNQNTTGSNNVALGFRSLLSNLTGGSNTAIGNSTLFFTSTGGNNVAIGNNAAMHQADGLSALTSTNNSIYIGADTQGYDNSDFNSIVIGTGVTGAGANKTVIGNSSMTDVYFGSAAGAANIHAKTLYLGSSTVPDCIVMGDTAGGVGYITLNSGVLTVSTNPPSACQ